MERGKRSGQSSEKRYFTEEEAATALGMIYSVLLKDAVLEEIEDEEAQAAQTSEYTQLPLAGIVFDGKTHSESDPAI